MIHVRYADGSGALLTREQFEAKHGLLPEANLGPHAAEANALRLERVKTRFSLRAMAKEMGVTLSWLSSFEHGRVPVTADLRGRYLSALNRLAKEDVHACTPP